MYFPPKDFVQVGYVSWKIITEWRRKKKYNQIKEACTPHRDAAYTVMDLKIEAAAVREKERSKKFASQNSMEGY